MEKKTVFAKMSAIKSELSKCKIPKSGKNTHSNFTYHELTDFMPFINDLNDKHGVATFPKFLRKEGICVLSVVNVEDSSDKYDVVIPFVEAQMLAKGGAPSNVDAIQRMGSTITYNRRYLYMSAYDIVESDSVDALPISTKAPEVNTTTPQAKAKPAITADRFAKALEAIQGGNQDALKQLIEKFSLTVEQSAQLETIKNQ
jgi:hypothetical protein